MEFAWLYEWLEQNNVPPGLILIVVLLLLICLFLARKSENKPSLVGRCKDCVYFRQNTSSHYLCNEYKRLLFPWSKKQSPCPAEERWKIVDEDLRLSRQRSSGSIIVNKIVAQMELPSIAAYETRKKEIEENAEPIEGIFYLYDGRVIPDYYSECLFQDKDNPRREEMYHHYFYPNYMQQKFTNLSSPNEKSIPRGRIAGTIGNPIIYIDGCYEQDMDVLMRLKELYRLPSVTVMPNVSYRCPACYSRK